MIRFLFIFICGMLCCQSIRPTEVYVWFPDKYGSLHQNKCKESEKNVNIWDSLYLGSDNNFMLKRSRFYDVGGNIIKDSIIGRWSTNGEYISIVPSKVNYTCVPHWGSDSVVSVFVSEIDSETNKLRPIKFCKIYVYYEHGLYMYYTDDTGRADIKSTSNILAIFIEKGYAAVIPFPQYGNRYDVTFPYAGTPNEGAEILKIQDNELWSLRIYKDSLQCGRQYKKIR